MAAWNEGKGCAPTINVPSSFSGVVFAKMKVGVPLICSGVLLEFSGRRNFTCQVSSADVGYRLLLQQQLRSLHAWIAMEPVLNHVSL